MRFRHNSRRRLVIDESRRPHLEPSRGFARLLIVCDAPERHESDCSSQTNIQNCRPLNWRLFALDPDARQHNPTAQVGPPNQKLAGAQDGRQPAAQVSAFASGLRPGRRRARAANSSDAGGLQDGRPPASIQGLVGQRLVVPCRNSSAARNFLDANGRPRKGAQLAGATSRFRTAAAAASNSPNSAPQIVGISLIVWHKDDQLNSPIFAADARESGGSIRDAKQQVIAEQLRGRVRLELVAGGELLGSGASQQVPALVVEEANMQDAGQYTCTVEFHKAPTQTYQVQVQVSDPPKNMLVRDETNNNQRLYSALAGPYDEDSRLVLACELESGQPEPGQVAWWQLDSVTYLSEALRRAGPPRAPAQAKPVRTLNEANYLTTLSLDGAAGSPSSGASGGAANPADVYPVPYATRDLYLGPGSLQSLEPNYVPPQAQMLLSQMNPTGGQLRHWIRVDNRTQFGEEKLVAYLEIQRLSRANLGDEFLCLASNNLQLAPANSSLSLNLNLKPTEVRLVDRANGTFRLDQKTLVECHVFGSKPSPTVKWFRGGQEVATSTESHSSSSSAFSSSSSSSSLAAHQTEEPRQQANLISELNRDINNLTKISYLTLVPQLSDNQQQLTCSAFNPRLAESAGEGAPPRDTLSQSIVMNVQFSPRLQLSLGTNIGADSIRLGSDVFMDCNIEANPAVDELGWLHNGRPLQANLTSGVYMSNQSLVLRHIKVHQRGAYECQARNQLGQSTSNKLELRPRFEPTCDRSLTKSRYEIALNQPTRIECHVLAEPSGDLHFSWRFNRTTSLAAANELAPSASGRGPEPEANPDESQADVAVLKQHETNFSGGSVVFTASSRRHYGQLLCSASNSMGRQERPCVIELVQSEQPGPVFGCFVDNMTHSSFSIHCQPPSLLGSPAAAAAPTTSPVSSPFGSASSANRYILEVYASDSAPTTGAGSQRAGDKSARGSDATHLQMRHPDDDDPQDRQLEYSSGELDDHDAGDGNEQASQAAEARGQQERISGQARVQRLKSELPSFDVHDLQPNASYSVLVYVENSKGRSPATRHQVSLRSLDGSLAGHSPQVAASQHGLELFAGGRRAGGGQGQMQAASLPASSPKRLLSYLKMDGYFNGASGARQPLIGVALVVLLSAVSIVAVVFFVNRLACRSSRARKGKPGRAQTPAGSRGHAGTRRPSGASLASSSSPDCHPDAGLHCAGTKRSTSTNSQQARQLSASAGPRNPGGRANGCASRPGPPPTGSGSDTSRETNTDSTLISSRQTEFSSDSLKGPIGYNTLGPRQCSHQDLSQQQAAGLQRQCYNSATMRPLQGKPNSQQVLYAQQMQQLDRQQPQNQDQSVTPLVSVHSSDCSSNNVDNSADLVSSHHLSLQRQQHYATVNQLGQMRARQNLLLADGPAGFSDFDLANADELTRMATGGVYVISDASLASQHQPATAFLSTATAQPPASNQEFWYSTDGSASGQVQSTSNRCHLVAGEPTNSPPSLQAAAAMPQLLPGSLSIPIALSDRLDLLARPSSVQLPDGQHHHRMSQGDLYHLQQASYLSLAPSSLVHQQQAAHQLALDCSSPCSSGQTSVYDLRPQLSDNPNGGCYLGQELAPPVDFAADYRRFKQTFGLVSGHQLGATQKQAGPPKHRVKFDTPSSTVELPNEPDGGESQRQPM